MPLEHRHLRVITGPIAAVMEVLDLDILMATDGIHWSRPMLTSRDFDFSAFNSPQISYYYHMYGADMGSLALQVNTGGGWTSLWSVSGQSTRC